MADLAPTNQQPEFDHSLVPVEYDPFAAGAAFGVGSPAETSQQPSGLSNLLSGAYNSLGDLAKRAIEGSAQDVQNLGDHSQPLQSVGPALEAAMLPMGTGAIAGVPLKAGETVLGAGPIRAYHGSPHDFDQFSLDKIGTGEGAQVYGHGLYFAENEEVARQYEKALSAAKDLPSEVLEKYFEPGQIVKGYSGLDLVKKYDPSSRAVTVRSVDKQGNPTQDLLGLRDRVHTTQPSLAELNQAFKERGLPEYKPGHMYEVNINADPEHFLDWDKPLPADHPIRQKITDSAQAALDNATTGANRNIAKDALLQAKNENLTGEGAYKQLVRTNTKPGVFPEINIAQPDKASEALREAGIPGIKYLDKGSRNPGFSSLSPSQLDARIESLQHDIAGGGGNQQTMKDKLSALQRERDTYKNQTRNYVIFDDNLINIIKKYGIAGLPAPIAAAASQQFSPVDHDPFAESN